MQQNDLLKLIVHDSKNRFGAYENVSKLILPEVPQPVGLAVYDFIRQSAIHLKLDDPDTLARQIAPKTIGFCGLVALGYTPIERIAAFMNFISSMYVLDQTIDTSDSPRSYKGIIDDLVLGRNRTENPIVELIDEQIAEFDPAYRNLMRQLSFGDVILRQYYLRVASIEYFEHLQRGSRAEDLLDSKNIRFLSHHLVTNVGLQLVANGAYLMLYKHGQVSTPLPKIIRDNTMLIRVLEGFLRACDDYGDRESDSGEHPNLNIFNQPLLMRGVSQLCEIDIDENTPALEVLRRFYSKSKDLLKNITIKSNDDAIFINLMLRVMEGGMVNILGDRNLEDGGNITPEDASDILHKIEEGLGEKNEEKV